MPPTVKLDGAYKFVDDLYKLIPGGAPSLVKCTKLTVEGEQVEFKAGVVVIGKGNLTLTLTPTPTLTPTLTLTLTQNLTLCHHRQGDDQERQRQAQVPQEGRLRGHDRRALGWSRGLAGPKRALRGGFNEIEADRAYLHLFLSATVGAVCTQLCAWLATPAASRRRQRGGSGLSGPGRDLALACGRVA